MKMSKGGDGPKKIAEEEDISGGEKKCSCLVCKRTGFNHGPDCKCIKCNNLRKKCKCVICKKSGINHGPGCVCDSCNKTAGTRKKRSNGHKSDCKCPICKNMSKSKKGGTRRDKKSIRKTRKIRRTINRIRR